MFQLQSLMEREALETGQSSSACPTSSQPEELVLFPAESSTLTTLPGVARVVHSKASCTVHWQESGKNRPNAKELPAAQILGIHTAPPLRTATKSGRGSAVAAGATVTVLSDGRRAEPLEQTVDSCAKDEEKRPFSMSSPVSLQQPGPPREESTGTGLADGSKGCAGVEASGASVVTKTTDQFCSGAESSMEQGREEQNSNTSSPEVSHTSPAKPPPTASEDGVPQGSGPAAKERTVEQIREEGWSARDADNVTLAELYLMSGKPGKLQLEYEWQSMALPHNSQENGQNPPQTKPNRRQRVLRCLLRLVATEVNPKPLVDSAPSFVLLMYSWAEIIH